MQRALFVLCIVASAALARPAEAEVYTSCHVAAVGTFLQRVHVFCQDPYPGTGIYWFATPTSDHAMASRMEAIGLVAQVTGATVYIYFSLADTSGTSFGCGASDCRRITAIEVHGLGPLAASTGGRTAGALAAISVPEPVRADAALAAVAALASFRRRRAA